MDKDYIDFISADIADPYYESEIQNYISDLNIVPDDMDIQSYDTWNSD